MTRCLISLFFTFLGGLICAQPHIPRFQAVKKDTASHGYYFFSPIEITVDGPKGGFHDVILDQEGNVVYSREYEEGFIAGNLQLHSNGRYSYFFDKKYYILDSLFNPVDTVFCQNGLYTDNHDLLILPNGHYALMGYENVTMDLSHLFIFKKNNSQGLTNAKVRCGVIQELTPQKKVVFEWHCKDHYQFEDLDTAYADNLYDIDWTHFNSLEMDRDGNYLVSVKHFNEITKVSRTTGKIIWRLGGKKNQFAFLKDSLMFKGQHHVRRTPNRFLSLFDNGSNRGSFHPEAAKEYRLDEKGMNLTLIWSHVNPAGASKGYGSFQRLPGRNALISYGRNPKSKLVFNAVYPNGRTFFEVSSNDSVCTYRAANYQKLPAPLPQPEIGLQQGADNTLTLTAPEGFSNYFWSTGETSRSISIHKNGLYTVSVPFGPGAYLYSKPMEITWFNKSNSKTK